MTIASYRLDQMKVITFHYLANESSADWVASEGDPILAELLEEGFEIFKSEEDCLNIYLQSEHDVQIVSKLTNYPLFLVLCK